MAGLIVRGKQVLEFDTEQLLSWLPEGSAVELRYIPPGVTQVQTDKHVVIVLDKAHLTPGGC